MLLLEGFRSNQIIPLDDRVLHKGEVFDKNGLPLYDVLIFFHNEYVSMKEIDNLRRYVKGGGNVIILNGNAFFAEVDYNPQTNKVNLLNGHGWEFDGENASKPELYYGGRFLNTETTNEHLDFFGSRYKVFREGSMQGAHVRVNVSNPHPVATILQKNGYSVIGTQYYYSHEENTLLTPNVPIIADWKSSFLQPDRGIKIYEKLPYGPYGGSVVHLAIYSAGNSYSSAIYKDSGLRKLLKYTIFHQSGFLEYPWIRYPYDNGVVNENEIPVDISSNEPTRVFLNGTEIHSFRDGMTLKNLKDGMYNLTVLFLDSNLTRTSMFMVDRKPSEIFVNGAPHDWNTKFKEGDWVNITIRDDNLNYIRIQHFEVVRQRGNLYQEIVNDKIKEKTISFKIKSKNHYYMSILSIDGAGNVAKKWLEFNKDANITIYYDTTTIYAYLGICKWNT